MNGKCEGGVQEMKVPGAGAPTDAGGVMPKVASAPNIGAIKAAARLLKAAKNPLILAGRVSRDVEEWKTRIVHDERLGERVVTDLKVYDAFPTGHQLHDGSPGVMTLASEATEDLLKAGAVISTTGGGR